MTTKYQYVDLYYRLCCVFMVAVWGLFWIFLDRVSTLDDGTTMITGIFSRDNLLKRDTEHKPF